jgi:hypothetical protein
MTTFSFGGTYLESFGPVTMINEYLDIPARRGSDMQIPFRHGSIFVKKFYDSRTMSFGIAVMEATAAALEAKIATMQALFSPLAQQTLSITMEDSSVRTASAVVNSPMQTNKIAPNVARVVVEFTLANPIFRSATVLASTIATIDTDPHALVVDNTGTVEERDPRIILTGPLNDVVITNSTNGLVLTYTGDIPAGSHVDIYTNVTGGYVAYLDDGSPPVVNVIGNVTHEGDTTLMTFNVGVNTLSIHSDVTTTGTVEVTFYPPYA